MNFSSWGKVEITDLNLVTADGDKYTLCFTNRRMSQQKIKHLWQFAHGGSDMLEQTSSYAIELSRRGYVVVTYDYAAQAGSDVPTGDSEGNSGISGYGKRGLNTIWNTVKFFTMLIPTASLPWGTQAGYAYRWVAIDNQEDIFLQVNIGMNMYGPNSITEHLQFRQHLRRLR